LVRTWYPDRFAVQIVAHGLAAGLFPDYGAPLPAFSFSQISTRENPLLESALALPRQPYYRTIYDKAGALLRSMVKNHPFIDGNKRLGMATTSIFMLMNGRVFWPRNDEMVRFALELAASEPDMSWQEVARWVRRNTLFRVRRGHMQMLKAARPIGIEEPLDHIYPLLTAFISTLDEIEERGRA
jgi:death-on-curing protein